MLDKVINNKLVGDKCLRSSEVEMQEHIVKCKETKKLQAKFTKELLEELISNEHPAMEIEEALSMLKDTLRHAEEE